MPHRIAAGSVPLATPHGVRFTLFDATRGGPQVYEVDTRVLLDHFGAPDTRHDHLIMAYLSGQSEIHAAAQALPGGHDGSVTHLGPECFRRLS